MKNRLKQVTLHIQMLRRSALHLSAAALMVLSTACSLYTPGGLNIDRSIQAKSQDSRVEFIVLHYTSAGNHASLKILSTQNVSSHYLITDDAKPHVYQLVDENRRAWHAGDSQWYGQTNLNASSIGIEIVNPGGRDSNWATYPTAQIDTLVILLKDIIQRHQIKPNNIVGHSDIAPQRKTDPGPLFPWQRLADAGIGRWYSQAKVNNALREFSDNGLPDILWTQKALERAGYQVPATGMLDHATRNVITAFQMHYRPSLYDGTPDAETLAILKALP